MKLFLHMLLFSSAFAQEIVTTVNPILFVTQTPTHGFSSVTQTFGNHLPTMDNAPRGGDLMIRYADGTLRNLTREAGFGDTAVMQGTKAIGVRQPCVHWSGTKALFSMVIGAPTKEWDVTQYYWQLYEVSGLGKDEQVVITKIPNQPEKYNNVSPIYGSDDRIIFTSDMAFNKKKHLYPQLDEYENARVVSGLWSLDRNTGDLRIIQHSPSGSFYPSIDGYGRIIFTRWDHLQRDQQADADRAGEEYGTFNYSSEDSNSVPLNDRTEKFPEPRTEENPDYDSTLATHTFNHFFPWEINQDGTEEETVNHVGRHEFGGSYSNGSHVDDDNLSYIIPNTSIIKNRIFLRSDAGTFHITEDPNNAGTYFATNAREFARETAGQLIKFSGALGMNPEDMEITALTHYVTSYSMDDGEEPDPNHSGHYKNPLPMSDGKLIVSHTTSHYVNANDSTGLNPKIRYNFRLKTVKDVTIDAKPYVVADKYLTSGIVRSLQYYNGNNYIISRTDTLWELDPVEVRSRTVPPLKTETAMATPEKSVFEEESVDEMTFRNWLKEHNLALIVSRNVTTRDRNDDTQPYNLKIPGGVENTPVGGNVYEVEHMQIFQGDMLRGQGGHDDPRAGRRILAQPMHDPAVQNPASGEGPAGSVKLGTDGSMASFVPAHRAMTWQLTSPEGKGVVRERYWITFQPGEIRTCASCHGVNEEDQSGAPKPQNKPEALRTLLQHWKSNLTFVGKDVRPIATFQLEQNYPNPFNPATMIAFQIPAFSPNPSPNGRGDGVRVTLKVYDLLGREVATLVNEEMKPGKHSVRFDASRLSTGVYIYTLRTRDFVASKKLLLMK